VGAQSRGATGGAGAQRPRRRRRDRCRGRPPL